MGRISGQKINEFGGNEHWELIERKFDFWVIDKNTLKENKHKLVKWSELNKKIQFALEENIFYLFIYLFK